MFSNVAARLTPGTPWAELVGPFVDANNLGTTRMLRAFAPILRPGGRLLVVASAFGSLRRLPPHLHERFDTDAIALDDLDATMHRDRASVRHRDDAGGAVDERGVTSPRRHPSSR